MKKRQRDRGRGGVTPIIVQPTDSAIERQEETVRRALPGDAHNAAVELQKLLRMYRGQNPVDASKVAAAEKELAAAFFKGGKWQLAADAYAAILKAARSSDGFTPVRFHTPIDTLADCYLQLKKHAEAAPLLEESAGIWEQAASDARTAGEARYYRQQLLRRLRDLHGVLIAQGQDGDASAIATRISAVAESL